MSQVTVITSVYGDDVLVFQPKQTVRATWIAVVDDHRPFFAATEDEDQFEHWEQVIIPKPHLHPRLASKVAKYRPDLFTEDEYVIWIDGSVRITSELFINDLLEWLGEDCDIGMLPHPDRSSISSEWPQTRGQERYRGQDVQAQALRYILELPKDDKLYVTAVIARRYDHTTREGLMELGNELMFEHIAGSYHDQLAMPFCLYNSMLDVAVVPWDLWHNHYFSLHPREVENP